MNFAPLKNGVEAIKRSAERYQAAVAKALARSTRTFAASPGVAEHGSSENPAHLPDRTRTPGRPWFKHQVYAPGAYTGYGAKPIAAVREYMDAKKWTEAEAQVPSVAKVLEDVAAAIGRAADKLEAATSSAH